MKTKGGKHMNPADAFRKEQRKKEIARNKAERKYIRDASGKKDTPETLKQELAELIQLEQTGALNKLQKLRKRVLQEAFEASIRRKKEEEFAKKRALELMQRGSNAEALPGPTDRPALEAPPGPSSKVVGLGTLPLPKPPPLPAGPKPPGLPPPPAAPPLPAGAPGAPAGTAAAAAAPPGFPPGPPPGALLPPPPGPPPGAPRLPPPAFPPPSTAAAAAGGGGGMLPPPSGPPPGLMGPPGGLGSMPPPMGPPPGVLPPPAGPPPLMQHLPPPMGPPPGAPPGMMGVLPPPSGPPPGQGPTAAAAAAAAAKKDGKASTITGASTVVKRPLAYKDKAVTSMVPASVMVRRQSTGRPKPNPKDVIGPGFGLAPTQRPAVGGSSSSSSSLSGLKVPAPAGLSLPGPAVPKFSAPAAPSGAGVAGVGSGAALGRPAGKQQVGVDEKLANFMDSLKDLGAFD